MLGILNMPVHSHFRKGRRREVERRVGEVLGIVGAVFAEGKYIGFGLAVGDIPIALRRVS